MYIQNECLVNTTRQNTIPRLKPKTRQHHVNTPSRYLIPKYGHVDIQLYGSDDGSSVCLNMLLTTGNDFKLSNLPATDYDTVIDLEESLSEIEQGILKELEEETKYGSTVLLKILLVKLRSILRSSVIQSDLIQRKTLQSTCHKILSNLLFHEWLQDPSTALILHPFITDVAYFFGSQLDPVYPTLIEKACDLLQVPNISYSRELSESLEYTIVMLVLQTMSEESIAQELQILRDIFDKCPNKDCNLLLSSVMNILILARSKQFTEAHFLIIESILVKALTAAPVDSFSRAMAQAFWKFNGLFPDKASTIWDQLTLEDQKILQSTKRIFRYA